MNPEEVNRRIGEGRKHLNFVTSLYRMQIGSGRHFLHEHPQTASSWMEVGVKSLAQDPSIHIVTGDQCMYGLVTPSENGETMPARKSTTFMTSSRPMADLLGKRCDKSHTHQPLVGGRCKDAAFYPLKLIQTILRGVAATRDATEAIDRAGQEHKDLIHSIMAVGGQIPKAGEGDPFKSSIPRVAGGNVQVTYTDVNFRAKYIDEYTGDTLEPEAIASAIREELNYFNSRVWQIELKSNVTSDPDAILVRSRWVLCNKGDNRTPDMRARLVACEINKGGEKPDAFFASTPPLAAKKVLFSRLAQERTRKGSPLRLSFLDVKKAYFNGIPRRDVYMSLPKELGLPSHFVGKQVRCVYGTRDAGAIWEETYREALESIGFTSGVASPCCFFHKDRGLSTVVHGDDISTLGLDDDLTWLEVELAKSFELKLRGRIGEGLKGDNDMRILNRIAQMVPEGLLFDADPRHTEMLTNSLGLEKGNAAVTPGIKEPKMDPDVVKTNEPDSPPSLVTASDTMCALSDTRCLPKTGRMHRAFAITRSQSTHGGILRRPNATYIAKSVNMSGTLHARTDVHYVPAYSTI